MEFQKNYLENSKQFQRIKMIATWLFPALMVFIILMEVIIGRFNLIGACILFVIAFFWVIFYPKQFLKQTLKRSAKILDDRINDGYLGQHKIEFLEDTIVHLTSESETIIKWVGIKKMEETETYYFLYNTTVSALIIPKLKLELSEEERNELHELLTTKIEPLVD